MKDNSYDGNQRSDDKVKPFTVIVAVDWQTNTVHHEQYPYDKSSLL